MLNDGIANHYQNEVLAAIEQYVPNGSLQYQAQWTFAVVKGVSDYVVLPDGTLPSDYYAPVTSVTQTFNGVDIPANNTTNVTATYLIEYPQYIWVDLGRSVEVS